jgi:AraC-like DNA-binding protein
MAAPLEVSAPTDPTDDESVYRIMELLRAPAIPGVETMNVAFLGPRHAQVPEGHVYLAPASGRLDIRYRGSLFSARAGQTVAFAPREAFVIESSEWPSTGRFLHVPSELVEAAVSSLRLPLHAVSGKRPLAEDPEGKAAFHGPCGALGSQDPASQPEQLTSCLHRLLLTHMGSSATTTTTPLAVRAARQLLHDPSLERFNLDDLATAVGMSKFHFIRIFRESTGLTPLAYWQCLRIGRARAMLSRGVAPAAAASELHFADQSHFGRVFRAQVGMTPLRYLRGLAAGDPTAP